MNVRMIRAHEYIPVGADPGVRRIAPANWQGELPDDVAKEAIKAGAAVKLDTEKSMPEEVEPDGFDEMTRAELDAEAERRGIDVSAARTKGDVVTALRGTAP